MKNKKIIVSLGLAGILLLGNVAGVAAADATDTSDAVFTLEVDDNPDPIGPLDPWDPDAGEELNADDTDANKNNSGQLRFDYISNFDFGEIELDVNHEQKAYAAVPTFDGDDKTNYVQISDFRGSGAGWTVTVSNTQFTGTDNTSVSYNNVLAGTEIEISNIGTSTTLRDSSNNFVGAATPTAAGVVLQGDSAAKLVMHAPAGSGTGTNIGYFGEEGTEAEESVELTIPANANKLAGAYKSVLTWTLTDTPLAP